MDFDNAKENIQPLAAGRNASILQAVLNIDYQTDLSKQRETLENAIAKYDGSDPLEPWFEYVSWIEQSYPSGGYEGGLKKVLIKCLEHFESDQRYLQDRRLIRIYIKFIDSEDNPPELYQELFNAGIGTMVSDLYICWAYYYDLSGNFKKADTIFRKGIELRAQPYNELIQAHKNFGFTMSQRMLYQDEQSKSEFLESLKKRRHALTSLTISTVGSIRQGNEANSSNIGNFQSVSDRTLCHSKNNTVLEDNRHIAVAVNIEPSKSIVRNIIECKRNQENKREAGPWSKRLPRQKGNLFKESNQSHDLGFTILEDELSITGDDCKHTNLSFDSPIQQQKVISISGVKLPLHFASKNDPQDIWKVETVLDNEPNPKTIPAYRKNYHYSKPNHDFSLEEYLAYNWFRKRNINNRFFKHYNIFWGNEISNGIRLYPNFVTISLNNDNNYNSNHEKFLASENIKLAVKINSLYPNDCTEMQFEELLYEKWQNQKLQSHIDSSNAITQKIANKISDSNAIEIVDSDLLQNSNKQESTVNFNPQISSMKSNKLKFETVNVDNKFEISDLYSQSINDNAPYSILNNLENENTLTDSDLLTSNESFSTHQFNLFIKKQSVSTPLSNRNQLPVNIHNDKNIGQNDIILPNKLLSKDLPENQHTFPIRQLSTIMETSESNTAVRKSSVDTHLNMKNNDKREFSHYCSNDIIIKNTNENDFSDKSNNVHTNSINSELGHIDKKLCEDSRRLANLVKNLFFEQKNTIQTLEREESCRIKNNELNEINGLTNSPSNLVNLGEKTEDFSETLVNQQTSVMSHSAEMFDFLVKTPEKKNTAILKINNYRCGNSTITNLSSEFSNFKDLSLPALSATPTTFKSSKTCDKSLSNFLKNTPEKSKNNNGQKYYQDFSNSLLIKNIDETEFSAQTNDIHSTCMNSDVVIGKQLFIKSKSDAKSLRNLVKNLSLDTDTIQTLGTDELYTQKKDVFKKENAFTNVSVNPVNFFEEKTENFSEVLVKQQSNVPFHSTEIFDFLAQTPEKKNTEIIKPNAYHCGASATENIAQELSNFEDLCLNSLGNTPNTCKLAKISENSLNFERDTPGKIYSEPKEVEEKFNNLINKKYEINSLVRNKHNILTNNTFKGNFHPDVYSLINRYKNKHCSIETTIKYQNNEAYNFVTYKTGNIKQTNFDKLFRFINSENYISPRSRLKENSLIIENWKSPHSLSGHLFPENLRNINKDIQFTERPIIMNAIQDKKNNNNVKLFTTFQPISGSLTAVSVPVISKYNQILQRFTDLPFDKNGYKNYSIKKKNNYSSKNYRFLNTTQTPKLENIVNRNDGHIIGSIKKLAEEKVNLTATNQYISEQIINTDVNPFSLDLIDAFLQKIEFFSYITQLESCKIIEKFSRLKKGNKIKINNLQIEVTNIIGQGAYGTVFCGKELQTSRQFAMKQEKPPNLWEYYICLELRNRILNADIICGFMDIKYAIISDNSSVFVTELSPYGSLITVCNKIKCVTSRNVDEYVVMMLISQILVVIDHLHASEIIHADIKPDNFLLMNKLIYGSKIPSIQLIDFGVSIDLKQFPRGQKFTFAHLTQEFQCVEMREKRPWNFQIDLYGVATIIHVLLFGKYMEIQKLPRGMWIPKQHIPRYLNKIIWDKIFAELLNIRDCDSMPNLQDLRELLEQEIVEKEKYVKDKILEFNKAIAAI